MLRTLDRTPRERHRYHSSLYSTVQDSTVTVQNSTVQHCTVQLQHSTVKYSTVEYADELPGVYRTSQQF